MDVARLIENQLKSNTIRELYLYQLPVLKKCSSWTEVKEVGTIAFQGKHANYDGAIIMYGIKYYFLPTSIIDSLRPFRQWNLKQKIAIITEEELKSKQDILKD